MSIQTGDVVQLKSGGPFMTAESTGEFGEVRCHWFNQEMSKYTHQSAVFQTHLLKKIENYS